MITLLNDDALRVLPTLETGSVDAVITDPPYCSGGTSAASRCRKIADKVQNTGTKITYPLLMGATRDQRGQLTWMTLWLSECLRVVKDNGTLLLFSDWRQLPLFTDAVQSAGWHWRSLVVWDKTEAARPNRGAFRYQAEYVIFATADNWKPTAEIYLPGVFKFPVGRKNHLTAKPVRLILELLRITPPGACVLDPFMGGGAVPKACVLTGRDCIGIELEPESFRKTKECLEG